MMMANSAAFHGASSSKITIPGTAPRNGPSTGTMFVIPTSTASSGGILQPEDRHERKGLAADQQGIDQLPAEIAAEDPVCQPADRKHPAAAPGGRAARRQHRAACRSSALPDSR